MGPCNVVVHQIATVGSSSRSMRKWQSDQGWGLEEVHHPWWRRRGSTRSLGLDLVNYKRGDTFLFLIFFKVYILVCGGVHWREWWAVNLIPVVVAWRRRVRRLRESALCFRAQDKQKRERERERVEREGERREALCETINVSNETSAPKTPYRRKPQWAPTDTRDPTRDQSESESESVIPRARGGSIVGIGERGRRWCGGSGGGGFTRCCSRFQFPGGGVSGTAGSGHIRLGSRCARWPRDGSDQSSQAD